MTLTHLNRRLLLLGGLALPSCTALDTLNQASVPLDVYDLSPVAPVGQGGRFSTTLLILDPDAAAAINTDRILVKPDALSVTYLPDARWADDVPVMMQSLMVRSLSATGRIGYVGVTGSGPVPDVVLLTRIDRFGVQVKGEGAFEVGIAFDLTLLRDRDQRVIGSRGFSGGQIVAGDDAPTIAQGFQAVIDNVLPDAVSWTVAGARGNA